MAATMLAEIMSAKPFLKWAGGKTQLLPALSRHIPSQYDTYIEPFLGGGAVFFYLRPSKAVLSDSNPELINCYQVVKTKVDSLIQVLQSYKYDRDFFYELRATPLDTLDSVERAARLVYLNRTCFNGLYRVNKQGEFNVPFGNYTNPKICDPELLRSASYCLQPAMIVEGDYASVLQEFANPGDFIFLDPPYYPVSEYADFKRYTKESFYEEDHVRLSQEFHRLYSRGAMPLLTNSNCEFTRRLYQDFAYEVVDSKRFINCNGSRREDGQDLIVVGTHPPTKTKRRQSQKSETLTLLERYPTTRYMGSKYNVLDSIWDAIKGLEFTSALDAFSGSGCVSYLLKSKGKEVHSNDILTFCYHTANGLIANPGHTLTEDDLTILLRHNDQSGNFIQRTFEGLYYSDEDNAFLDQARANIELLHNPYKRSLALAALVRACLKRRPRGIFTYVGHRYDDQRPDLQMSLRQHFVKAIEDCNLAVFDNGLTGYAHNGDIFALDVRPDLVYIDPPYYSPLSDSDYLRRYHFVEGLVRFWDGVEIDHSTKTKKFKKYPTAFDGQAATYAAFPRLFEKFRESILVVSYSSNSLPTKSEIVDMLKQIKSRVTVFQVGHLYSFGNQHTNDTNANDVHEYIFVAE